jgi:hypothetical protein
MDMAVAIARLARRRRGTADGPELPGDRHTQSVRSRTDDKRGGNYLE